MEPNFVKLTIALVLISLAFFIKKKKKPQEAEYFGGRHYSELPKWDEIADSGDTCQIITTTVKDGITILEVNKSTKDKDGIPHQEIVFAQG